MNTYVCPVCGYPGLVDPPADYNICECCGTEFGYHDFTASHDELRRRWIEAGAHWHSRSVPEPPLWSAAVQLRRAGLPSTERADPATARREIGDPARPEVAGPGAKIRST